MWRASLVLFLLFPVVSASQGLPELPGPAGTWVPAELRRALEKGERGPLPCLLEVNDDLTASEICGSQETSWGRGQLTHDAAGATTVDFSGEPQRELLHRPGVPHELLVRVGSEDAGQVVRRLYRLPPNLVPALDSRRLETRLFSGRLQADTGVLLEFGADGRYAFGPEHGSYRVDTAGAPLGTSGVLVLTPDGGAARAYHLTEAGGRIGLSPIAGPWPPPAPPAPQPWAPAGSSGAAVDMGFPTGAGGAAGSSATGGSGGGAGGEAAATVAPPSVWLTPAPAPVAPPELPDAGPLAAPDAGPPPIAQPIAPRSHCGCDASSGAASLALVAVLGRRRRR